MKTLKNGLTLREYYIGKLLTNKEAIDEIDDKVDWDSNSENIINQVDTLIKKMKL